ncbi:zinc transporter ZntB [Neptunomonas sp.]|uniref:zinc transporter ZntB n=1 Tax=Neptunomonas sp. TaxID=1971898 RepID=UPI003565E98B
MNSFQPLQYLALDRRGGAQQVIAALNYERDPSQLEWLHLDYKDAASIDWLRNKSGIAEVYVDALTADDPRPRSLVVGDSLLLILRGINLNSGANPEDMVSLRLWIQADRVLTLRHRRLNSVQEVADQLDAGNGPASPGELLNVILSRLLAKIGSAVGEIEDSADELEELVLSAESRELRSRLSALRRQSISLRRFIAPQRETIAQLYAEHVSWLSDEDRAHLRESADRITRYIEDLDAARDRAAVTYEELSNRLAEQMNNTMYQLSVIAAIFLPLGLLTGLLGINVGGIPGTQSSVAFTLVTLALLGIGVLEWWWFKRKNAI